MRLVLPQSQIVHLKQGSLSVDIETAELCDALRCEIGKLGCPGSFVDIDIACYENDHVIHLSGVVYSWYIKQLLIAAAQRACGNVYVKTNGNGHVNGGSPLAVNGVKKRTRQIDASQLMVIYR